MKKLIPVVLVIIALLAGAGGGYFLRASALAAASNEGAAPGEAEKAAHGDEKAAAVYMKFSRQFVAPIVVAGRPSAMMILDVNIEIDPSLGDTIYAEEPRLRDAVLKVLLRQGSTGALASIFADPNVLEDTRAKVLAEARAIVGDGAKAVLIMDVGYQKF